MLEEWLVLQGEVRIALLPSIHLPLTHFQKIPPSYAAYKAGQEIGRRNMEEWHQVPDDFPDDMVPPPKPKVAKPLIPLRKPSTPSS
jgi:hypothetical protein